MSLRADWLLKQVTCLMFYNWPLVTWRAELQATPSAGSSQAETEQFTPLQLSLQLFGLIENLCCKLDLKERDNKRNKIRAKAKTGRGGGSRVDSLGVSCCSELDFQMLPTSDLRVYVDHSRVCDHWNSAKMSKGGFGEVGETDWPGRSPSLPRPARHRSCCQWLNHTPGYTECWTRWEHSLPAASVVKEGRLKDKRCSCWVWRKFACFLLSCVCVCECVWVFCSLMGY